MSATIYSQPASTSTGQDARTNVLYAITRLKEKSPQAIPRDELVSYVLPAQAVSGDPQRVDLFLTFLNNNEKVTYHRATDSYSFRPLHNIFTADDLLAYLQQQETATGISVRDLKDGWADVETTIDRLEQEHKLLVTRNKKDNHPRMVWIDDPTLWLTVDGEYKDIWDNIPVPDKPDDVIHALKSAGFKPAGTVSQPKVKKVEKGKKKRETRAILRKAGKRIGQLSAQNAVSESKIHSPESQIQELRGPKTRKRVAVDPNTGFANIDAIMAMDEAAEQEARIKAREPEKEAKKTADELAKAKMQDFMSEWQAM